jgi:hypothetical protein
VASTLLTFLRRDVRVQSLLKSVQIWRGSKVSVGRSPVEANTCQPVGPNHPLLIADLMNSIVPSGESCPPSLKNVVRAW